MDRQWYEGQRLTMEWKTLVIHATRERKKLVKKGHLPSDSISNSRTCKQFLVTNAHPCCQDKKEMCLIPITVMVSWCSAYVKTDQNRTLKISVGYGTSNLMKLGNKIPRVPELSPKPSRPLMPLIRGCTSLSLVFNRCALRPPTVGESEGGDVKRWR